MSEDVPPMAEALGDMNATEQAAEKAGEQAAETSGGSGPRVIQGLLSTEPHGPAEDQIALILRGGKKFINGVSESVSISSGTTAFEDFLRGGLGFVSAGGEQQQQQQQPEQSHRGDDDAVSGAELADSAEDPPV